MRHDIRNAEAKRHLTIQYGSGEGRKGGRNPEEERNEFSDSFNIREKCNVSKKERRSCPYSINTKIRMSIIFSHR